jgi:hypothetical protein
MKYDAPHMEMWYRIMRMVHTRGTKESEKKKADLRHDTYFRAVNQPYIEQEEKRLKALIDESILFHEWLMDELKKIQN